MRYNVHPYPDLIFPWPVCANVTWKGLSFQCCTCSKWVYLRCTFLFYSDFDSFSSSYFWSCPSSQIVASPWGPQSTNTVISCLESSSPYTFTFHNNPLNHRSSSSSSLTAYYPFPVTPLTSPWTSFQPTSTTPRFSTPGFFSCPLFSFPLLTLRVFKWNAEGLRARSVKLLHFLLLFPVDLICIQKSNLNSFSSFRIPGYYAQKSDCTHSRSVSVPSKDSHAGGSVFIFLKKGLSFLKLSICSFSWLDLYSNYVDKHVSLKNSSSLS